MIFTCLCLLDGIAAYCMTNSLHCTASSSVAYDCNSVRMTSGGVKHCCCASSNEFCSQLSDCNAASAVYPDAQCRWQWWLTGVTSTFLSYKRYKVTMDGAHNFIDVQVQSTDYVSAYLARGTNCDIYATDSGFRGHKLLSDSGSAGWQFDTGDWDARTPIAFSSTATTTSRARQKSQPRSASAGTSRRHRQRHRRHRQRHLEVPTPRPPRPHLMPVPQCCPNARRQRVRARLSSRTLATSQEAA